MISGSDRPARTLPVARRRLEPERERRRPDRLLRLLDDPVVALLPWFAFTFLLEPMTFLGASLVAFALSASLVFATWMRGSDPRAFEVSDAVLFGLIVAVALFREPSSQSWLSDHADAVSNVVLTIIAFVSLASGRPFTAQYTAIRFGDADERLLARLDRESTLIWGIALAMASLVAIYGEWILDQQSNLWTAWILQTAPLIVALDLTLWIDRRAIARAERAPDLEPRPAVLARDLLAWLLPIGVLCLVFDGGPPALGWALVAIGIAGPVVAWAVLIEPR
jgi:uncharacterized membrane protein